MGLPAPDIKIATSLPIEPLLFVFWKMGMTEDDNIKSLHELPMSEGLESRRRIERLFHVILLVAHLAEPSGDGAGEFWACPLHKTIGPSVLQRPSKSSILPLFWIG